MTRPCVLHALAAIAVWMLFCPQTSEGVEQAKVEPAVDVESFVELPSEWSQLGGEERTAAITTMADRFRANYDKLHTWEGTYFVQVKQSLSAEAVKNRFTSAFVGGEAPALVQETSYTIRFVTDLASGNLYRDKKTAAMKFTRDGTNETVSIPNIAPVDGRSVLTTEHYVFFDPTIVWPQFATVRGNPKALNKRAAFRKPPEVVDRSYGDLINPCVAFRTSDNRHLWEELAGLVKGLRGEMGGEARESLDESLSVSVGSGPRGLWHRLNQTFKESESTIHMSLAWSPESTPVDLSLVAGENRDHPLRRLQWTWRLVNGIYCPEKVKDTVYARSGNGQLSIERALELRECAVNQPVQVSRFSYQGLGMKDGDLVMDEIEKACYLIEGGEPQKLANYNAINRQPGSGLSSLPRWKLVLFSSVLVIFLLALLILRRQKSLKLISPP